MRKKQVKKEGVRSIDRETVRHMNKQDRKAPGERMRKDDELITDKPFTLRSLISLSAV